MRKLESLCMLKDLPEGKPRLVRLGEARFACVRRGHRVDVVEDRCPHEGHPLSMGLVRDGVLTCPWHNWKFDLETGRCLFGGEAVRRYPCEVLGEEVFVDRKLDVALAEARLREDFVRAVAEGSVEGAVREGLRLVATSRDPLSPYAALARVAATRTPYGAGDGLVGIDAALRLRDAGVLDDAEALAVAAQAVADEVRARAARPLPGPKKSTLAHRDEFLEDLLEERRSDAVARVLGLPMEVPAGEIVATWLVPFASLKLWDRGATLPRVSASAALAARLAEPTAREILVSVATALGWAVAESDLPAWRATRAGLAEAARTRPGTGPLERPAEYEAALLRSERAAVRATLAALSSGVAPRVLLTTLAHAALVRLVTYDVERSLRVGSDVTAHEAARAVVLADATLRLPESRFAAAHAVMLAGLVGRLGRLVLPSFDLDLGPTADDAGLLDVARRAALRPRCSWASRGRAAAAAAACFSLGRDVLGATGLAAAALRHGTHDDEGGGLERLAATAARIVRDGEPPEGLGG